MTEASASPAALAIGFLSCISYLLGLTSDRKTNHVPLETVCQYPLDWPIMVANDGFALASP